jgi:hypothetical protein
MSDVLNELFAAILDRQANPHPGSCADVEAKLVQRRR